MKLKIYSIALVLTLALAALPANADGLNDPLEPVDDFVVNGDFEIHRAPTPMGEEVCEIYGEDQWLPPPPAPPLVILGCDLDEGRSTQWGHHDDTHFGDFTGDDGIEVRIGGSASHNLWQAYPSPHQAYSARMDDYTFQVKWSSLGQDGAWEVPDNAAIRLSLSTSPAQDQNPWLVAFIDCDLKWDGTQINDAMDADGVVRLDPLDATFRSTFDTCDGAATEWEDGSDEEKLDLLGRLRIVQNSFWHFNAGGNVVVVDNIGSNGSTLAAQEILAGNVNGA